ncbi:hypothetical protein SUGI_0732040 [Cryptomeria japonica]|nr:hypothetical protein SUGI_0732040 [Cryptomeria japonica]
MKELLALHLIDRTIRVCIWGIGGIDIRAAQDHGNIVGLQTQMLKDLSKLDIKVNDTDHGKSLLQFHLRSIRSLVILDNVDHRRQLECFKLDCCGAGSRIIITTRDCGSLNISIPPENIYELQGLEQDEALELFSWHAFHQAQPDVSFRNLSTKIVKASGGVPLTLEVLGSFLIKRKSSDKYWVEALRKLKNLSYQEIFEPLKISYDSLLASEKEIFLDIACYFVDQDTEEPIIFWEELGLDVDTALHNLQQKLLIKIGDDNRFRMHDLLRDLGRAIVADESPGNPGERSRLWKQKDVHKVITEKRGTQNVKYLLHVQESEGTILKKRCLASMNGLRYLCFNDTILMEGDTSKLSPDLKWFKWKRCSLDVLPSQWNLEHLAILDLSSRSISHGSGLQFSLKQLWTEQSHRKMPKNLKVLRVNWCPNLQRLPTFSNLKYLVRLDLTGCSLITELPDSLGLQAQLYHLELSFCSRLEKLPDCIGNLLELKHLGLAECSSLKALPYSIGCLQKLEYLNLIRCEKLEQLPTCITKLSCLQKLILSYCSNLRRLPEILEGLKSLKTFELRDAFEIGDLPRTIGSLSRLEKLDLESCLIVTLPESVCHLKHLRSLNMNHCEFLCVLPDEIGRLESLEELLLNKCDNLTTLPSSFSKLESLVRFEAGYCDLKFMPENFGELSSLKILHLEYNKFSTLPLSCAVLSQLTELVLRGCTDLTELPILPEGLITLDIEDCIKLKTLAEMAHLCKMQLLIITRCSNSVQSNILWEVRALTALEIRYGHGNGETVRLTGERSWNDHFRAEFEVMFRVVDLKRLLHSLQEVSEGLIQKVKGLKADNQEDFKEEAESLEGQIAFNDFGIFYDENLNSFLKDFKLFLLNVEKCVEENVVESGEQIENPERWKRQLKSWKTELEQWIKGMKLYCCLRWYREKLEMEIIYQEMENGHCKEKQPTIPEIIAKIPSRLSSILDADYAEFGIVNK